MRHLLHLLTLLAITLLLPLAACTSADEANTSRLAEAEAAVSAGDNAEAKKMCDDILSSSDAKALTATQLAELSLLYMQLSDRDDMEDNTAIAFQCYRNALKANRDSAMRYYADVTGENARYVQMLSQLLQMMENPEKNNIEEDEPTPAEND